jgi:hypothetical protein
MRMPRSEYTITERPPDPPPMRPAAVLYDAGGHARSLRPPPTPVPSDGDPRRGDPRRGDPRWLFTLTIGVAGSVGIASGVVLLRATGCLP